MKLFWSSDVKEVQDENLSPYSIFEESTDPVAIFDAEYRLVMANRSFSDLYSFPPQELIGHFCYQALHKRKSICDNCHLEDVFHNGKPKTWEEGKTLTDGLTLNFQAHATPVKDRQGVTLFVVLQRRDITHQKLIEASNRSAQAFSRKIINSITDSLIVIDPKTYRIVEANDHFIKRIGKDYAFILQKNCYQVMRRLSSPCPTYGMDCPVRKTARKNQPVVTERIYPDSKGRDRILQVSTYPLLDSQEKVNLVIRLEHDITARRKMEEILATRTRELEKANRKLKTLFDMSKQLTSTESLTDLINNIFRTSLKIFPDIEPVFILLDAEMDGFLPLDSCDPGLVKSLQKIIKRLETTGMLAGFITFLNDLKDSEIINFEDRGMPTEVKLIFQGFTSGFGLPIFVRQQCIGYFQICSTKKQQYDSEDRQFFRALFSQIAGHIRRLVLHRAEISKLRRQVVGRVSFGEIIGQSQAMQKVYNKIDLVANSDATVLITGENGTGKELVAQAIHRIGRRRAAPFVVANCAAYAPTLLESEIFGHEKGAFTGAVRQKKGRIERAHSGTLFLDEIGSVSRATQVLLLRFLQNRCFERVGGETTIQTDVRVLAATNRNLQEDVQEGHFRSDLYYRLNVLVLHLSPLRERKEDIPLLTQHFLEKHALAEGKKVPKFDPDDMHLLMDYHWPGNVRQLENAVSHAVIMTQGSVCNRYHLPKFLVQGGDEPVSHSLVENERLLILRVLQECKWNKHETAKRLRVSRSTLYSKIKRHGLYDI